MKQTMRNSGTWLAGRALVWLMLPLMLLACKGKRGESGSEAGTIGGEQAETATLTVEDARLFSIENIENGHKVRVFSPQGDTLSTYVLLSHQAATQYQSAVGETVVAVPLERMALLSDTFMGAAELLDALDRVVATSDTATLYNEAARERARNGALTGVSREGTTDAERLIALRPDGIMANYFEGVADQLNIPKGSGIPILYNNDWQEATLLGRAEWIKFVGLLTGKGKEAQEFYHRAKAAYDSVRQSVKLESSLPDVLFGQAYKGVWYLPAADSYIAAMLQDAGAQYNAPKTSAPGAPLSFEQVYLDHHNDAVWLAWHSGTVETYADFLKQDKHYAKFRAFTERNVWLNNGKVRGMANDYFEQGPYRPEQILSDLVYIFHPSLRSDAYRPAYWQQLK